MVPSLLQLSPEISGSEMGGIPEKLWEFSKFKMNADWRLCLITESKNPSKFSHLFSYVMEFVPGPPQSCLFLMDSDEICCDYYILLQVLHWTWPEMLCGSSQNRTLLRIMIKMPILRKLLDFSPWWDKAFQLFIYPAEFWGLGFVFFSKPQDWLL